MKIFSVNCNAAKRRPTSATVMLTVYAVIVFVLTLAVPSRSQSQNKSAAPPVYEYEVVSIKPTQPGGAGGRGGRGQPTDGLAMNNVTMQLLLEQALDVREDQLSGAPSWLTSERYDLNAKMDTALADEVQKLSVDERKIARRKMMQALLVDRLKLTFHTETKERPIYSLVVAKNGPKLQNPDPKREIISPDGAKRPAGPGMSGQLFIVQSNPGEFTMMGFAIPVPTLVSLLSDQLDRPVFDKTELAGKYDITMKWGADDAGSSVPGTNQPSATPRSMLRDMFGAALFTALQEQLGLKLEAGKGPVEIIVIDHIERPSGN